MYGRECGHTHKTLTVRKNSTARIYVDIKHCRASLAPTLCSIS